VKGATVVKRTLLVLTLLAMFGWTVFTAAMPGGTTLALAAPAQILCNRVYLPALFGGGGIPEVSPTGPVGVSAVAQTAECAGFPDFNGDGYADLVVGVPHKEVFDGVVNQVDAGIVQGRLWSAGRPKGRSRRGGGHRPDLAPGAGRRNGACRR
jgi:hypothetical protein